MSASVPFTVKPLRSSAPLSKSRFVHSRQCQLYAWLETRTDLPKAAPTAAEQARFDVGNEVGELARQRWDNREIDAGRAPGVRVTDDPRQFALGERQTAEAIADGARVIHEATLTYAGAKARIDVLERLDDGTWALNEVKSSTAYKADKHLLDASIQLWIARGAGVNVSRVRLVHLNNAYVWDGGPHNLEMLFTETDVTEAAEAMQAELSATVPFTLDVLYADQMPPIETYPSCTTPYACPYLAVCPALPEPVEHPISELPRGDKVARRIAERHGVYSLLELDEVLAVEYLRKSGGELSETWINTWRATLTNARIVTPEFTSWVEGLAVPIRHLDFESINPAIPVVVGTRPYQQVPLQYSLHTELGGGELEHREFIAEPDDPDPMRSVAEHLIADLGTDGAILHWSSFEDGRIGDLAAWPSCADLRDELLAIRARLRDLGKAVDIGVFQREFHGSWSIKKVHPALTGVRAYDELAGTAKGDDAALALLEYRDPSTSPARVDQIRTELLAYCEQDTLAQVEVLAALR